jgi:hypothetical protein
MTMPQLPSGRQVALIPTPLDNLLKEGRHFGNIHKVLAIQAEADLYRYVEIFYLVPEGEASSRESVLGLHADSLPVPPGMAFMPAGFKLSEWEAGSGWSEADRAAFRDFLASRCAPVLREWLDTVKAGQANLHEAEDPLTRLLVAWWDAGCHPAQEEGWDASDVGTPDWDDYDLLAALGQACVQLAQRPEPAGQREALARLQAFWNICRRELPQVGRMAEAARPVRDCAAEMRSTCLLEALEGSKRRWLHDQAVAECVQLWHALGEGLRAAVPQPCGIIELVVVSPEANRYFEAPQHRGNEDSRN